MPKWKKGEMKVCLPERQSDFESLSSEVEEQKEDLPSSRNQYVEGLAGGQNGRMQRTGLQVLPTRGY